MEVFFKVFLKKRAMSHGFFGKVLFYEAFFKGVIQKNGKILTSIKFQSSNASFTDSLENVFVGVKKKIKT